MLNAYNNPNGHNLVLNPNDILHGTLGVIKIPYIDMDKLEAHAGSNIVDLIDGLFTKLTVITISKPSYNQDVLVMFSKYSKKYYAIEIDYKGNNYVQIHDDLYINTEDYNIHYTYDDTYNDYSSVITCGNDMIDESTAVYLNDEWYHEDDSQLTRCDECGEYMLTEHDHGDNNITLCEECYQANYTTCDGCNTVTHRDYVYYCEENDMQFCESCYNGDCEEQQDYSGVHSYSYKPSPIFYGKGRYHFGIELECNFTDMGSAIEELNQHDEIYLKEDSSVNGIEIVSHPMTLKYFHDNILPAIRICAKEHGGKAHNVGGIHVHIGRDRFKDDLQFSNFYDLVNNYVDFTEIIAQRSIQAWSAINPYNGEKSLKDTYNYNSIGRYSAININNMHTIELRIFNSNLRRDRILKNLEYVHALLDFTRQFNSNKLHTFLAYVMACPELYPNLINFIKERGVLLAT